MSTQNYYKKRKERKRKEVNEGLIEQLVKEERRIQPRLGGRKLFYMLKDKLYNNGVAIGRDRFYNVLRRKGLLLSPLPKAPYTTMSNHNLPVFNNLIKDIDATAPNQVWVSDITYIRTLESFLYLSLITDKCSRKIVGYNISNNLSALSSLKALRKALFNKPKTRKPIHHSDRGSQYCSHLYVEELQKQGIKISMTEQNHCAENAMAERVNGILKQEYALGETFKTKAHAKKAIEEAVYLYNNRRPHQMLNYKTPEEVHSLAA